MKNNTCKIVYLGRGKGKRYLCKTGGRVKFVKASVYRKRQGLSGTGGKKSKRKKTTLRRKTARRQSTR